MKANNQKESVPFQFYQAAKRDLTELSFQALLSKIKTKDTSNQIDECNLDFWIQQRNNLPHPGFESNYSNLWKESKTHRTERKNQTKLWNEKHVEGLPSTAWG